MSRLEWHEIEGWFTAADAEALGKLCDRVDDGGRIVEVGSFLGRSTIFMAHRVQGRRIRILTVDNFRGGEPEVDVLMADSLEAAAWLCGLRVDLVFLDGNHHSDVMMKDLNAWFGFDYRAGPARRLCGHDAREGPGRVVRERFGDRVRQKANVWWLE